MSHAVHAALDDCRWLASDSGAARLRALAPDAKPSPALAASLRRDLSAGRVHLLLQQLELRRRAAAKFARSAEMLFTPRGLEQATDQWTAAYKAGRFPAERTIVDLCCGLGGDLLALAARARAIGVDLAPAAAILAAANARRLGLPRVECLAADVGTLDLDASIAWHIDPDRRPAGRRSTTVEHHQPPPEVIERLLARAPAGAVKLAPAARWPDGWTPHAQWEWLSRRGECRQLVAWFGELAREPGMRRATIIDQRGQSVRTLVGNPALAPPVAAALGRYVVEPDAAVLAARLTGVLAAEHGLAAVADGVAYLTGDTLVNDPAFQVFEVQDAMPYNLRRLKAWLRQHNVGRLEVKKRSVPYDPQDVRRQLTPRGDEAAVLLIARLPAGDTAILARRVTGDADPSSSPTPTCD